MKFLKTKFLFTAFLMLTLAFVGCEKDVASGSSLTNYVGMEPSKYVGVAKDATVTAESKIYATDVSNVDRTFTLFVDSSTTLDPSYYTVPATVTIPAGQKIGVIQVGITGTDLGSGKILVVGLETVSGVNYATSYTTSTTTGLVSAVKTTKTTFTIEETCDLNKVVLSITFDNYPEETAWELYDSSSTVIASGGIEGGVISGYAALGFADQSTFTTSFCLPSGDYTFVIYDDYGDGMYTSASVQGTYSVKLGDTVLASGQGNFGSIADTAFTLP